MNKRWLSLLTAFGLVFSSARIALADVIDVVDDPVSDPASNPLPLIIVVVAIAIAATVGILSRKNK